MKLRDIKELIRVYDLDDDTEIDFFHNNESYDIKINYISKSHNVIVLGFENYTCI